MDQTTTKADTAMEKRVSTFLTVAHRFQIESTEDLTEANDQLIGIKTLRLEIGRWFKPMHEAAKLTVKEIKDKWVSFDQPLIDAVKIHEKSISVYYRLLEAERIEAQKKIDDSTREKAREALKILEEKEKEKKKDARDALAEGDLTKYQEIVKKVEPLPIVETPKEVDTLPEVPTLKDSTLVRRWKFRIIDAAQVPIEFRKIDEVKIGQYVRAMKKDAAIPGIEVYYEDTVSSRIKE